VIVQAPAPSHHPAPAAFAPPRRSGAPVLPFLLPLVIVGGVLLATFHEQLSNLTGIGAWDGSEPLVCDGNDQLVVSGVKASFKDGTAVVARGNCHVTLKRCELDAAVGIQADGNAHVTVIGGAVRGKTAIDASGNAVVDLLANAATTGAVHRTGSAQVTGK
jgi:hypothetical protein